MSDLPKPNEQLPVPLNGWERHKLEQLRRLSKLSFSEKLEWLEQAQRIAEQLRKYPEDQPARGPRT